MSKFCPRCGQLSDDTAIHCAACGAPFGNTYPMDDEPVTVVADDVYRAQEPAPAYQPPTQPDTYQQPDPAPTYQQPNTYQPPITQNTYQPPVAPNTYQPNPQQNIATPLNMGTPHYATPVQRAGYQPAPEKQNRNTKLGIIIGVAAVVVIAAVVLIIVLVSGGSGSASLPGNYVLASQTDHGTTYTRDQIKEMLGAEITMTISSDNVGTIYLSGAASGTLAFNPSDHTVSSSDAGTGTYTLSGSELTLSFDNGSIVNKFTRQ